MPSWRRIYNTCISIYKKAKKRKPNKPEQDYLKLVLLTKPPYDLQVDEIIDDILSNFPDIEAIAEYIAENQKPTDSYLHEGEDERTIDVLWRMRSRNQRLREQELKERNRRFFASFWEKY